MPLDFMQRTLAEHPLKSGTLTGNEIQRKDVLSVLQELILYNEHKQVNTLLLQINDNWYMRTKEEITNSAHTWHLNWVLKEGQKLIN